MQNEEKETRRKICRPRCGGKRKGRRKRTKTTPRCMQRQQEGRGQGATELESTGAEAPWGEGGGEVHIRKSNNMGNDGRGERAKENILICLLPLGGKLFKEGEGGVEVFESKRG